MCHPESAGEDEDTFFVQIHGARPAPWACVSNWECRILLHLRTDVGVKNLVENATAASSSQINLVWTDTSGNEDGFKIKRCRGARLHELREVWERT